MLWLCGCVVVSGGSCDGGVCLLALALSCMYVNKISK